MLTWVWAHPLQGAPLPWARESPPGTRGLSAGRPGTSSQGLLSPTGVGREERVTDGCFNSVPEIRGDCWGQKSVAERMARGPEVELMGRGVGEERRCHQRRRVRGCEGGAWGSQVRGWEGGAWGHRSEGVRAGPDLRQELGKVNGKASGPQPAPPPLRIQGPQWLEGWGCSRSHAVGPSSVLCVSSVCVPCAACMCV